MTTELLLIAGASGVGKTSAALALHERLAARGVMHAVIEGDYLDLAEPAPHIRFPGARLAERVLAAQWSLYRELGYRRLVVTNTVSVLVAADLAEAMGDTPHVTGVLLQAGPAATAERLAGRGDALDVEAAIAHSLMSAAELEASAPPGTHRVTVDDRRPQDVASVIEGFLDW